MIDDEDYPAFDLDKRTRKPQQVMDALDVRELFKMLPPHLAKRCRCAYVQGRIETLELHGLPTGKERRLLGKLERESP